MEQLTTPELKESDAVFPGENWFFYWRTSPSLWKAKLQEYSSAYPIFVPLNWGLHGEFKNQYDFGQNKPEADLKRLEGYARELGKELVYLLPVTPSPFLVNGGVPAYLARNIAHNSNDLAVVVIDDGNRVNKMYSFFDPRLFQAFQSYVKALGSFLSQAGINSPVYMLDCHRFENEKLVSFFEDHSKVFLGGFNRYIKQLQDSEPEKIQKLIENGRYEQELQVEYNGLIKSLYTESVKEYLAGSLAGELPVAFLGGETLDLFKRTSFYWENSQDYFLNLMNSAILNMIPSSVLLGPNIKSGVFGQALKDYVTTSFLKEKLNDGLYSGESSGFHFLIFFNLYTNQNLSLEKSRDHISVSGLKTFLNEEFPWTYKFSQLSTSDLEDVEDRSICFFNGDQLTENELNLILKYFINGKKVFLDTNGLHRKLKDKIEVFFAENSIDTEKINYLTTVTKASLGEGVLITYDGKKLTEVNSSKQLKFWKSLIDYLGVRYLKVETESGVQYFWKYRLSNSYELNYQEIRRVHFYNPTSYKKKVHIISSKNFAFIKSLDQNKSEIQSTPIGIDLLLLPGGSMSLDFGYFES